MEEIIINIEFEDNNTDYITQIINEDTNQNNPLTYKIIPQWDRDNEFKGYYINYPNNDLTPIKYFITDDSHILHFKLPVGEYTVNTISKNNLYTDNLSKITVIPPNDTDEINSFSILMKVCSDVLIDKSCKYFHHEPYMTPNNFDLYFDYRSVPVNIKRESPLELQKRLQNYLPLTKILHLNLEEKNVPESNQIYIQGNCSLQYNRVKDNLNTILVVEGDWDDNLLNHLLVQDRFLFIKDWLDNMIEVLIDYDFTNFNPLSAVDENEFITNIIQILSYNDSFNSIKDSLVQGFDLILVALLQNIPEDEFDIKTPSNIHSFSEFKDFLILNYIYNQEDYENSTLFNLYSLSKEDYKIPIDVYVLQHNQKIDAETIQKIIDYINGVLKGSDEDIISNGYNLNIPSNSDYFIEYINGLLKVDDNIMDKNIMSTENNFCFNTMTAPMFEEDKNGKPDINKPITYTVDYQDKYIYECTECGFYYLNKPEECSKCNNDNYKIYKLFTAHIKDYDKSATIKETKIII